MYQRPTSERPAYPSPAKRGLPPFQNDWWQCIPLPLSPYCGFGMNVADLLLRRATFFTTYLNHMRLSAIEVRVENFIPISHWPALATSWWPTSTSIPLSISVVIMSARRSPSTSVGATGK